MMTPHAFPEILQNVQNLAKKFLGPSQRPLKICNPFFFSKNPHNSKTAASYTR